MSSIDAALIETLLNMNESAMLDFKRDQYPLATATEEQKSELVKDIVAFANAWKTDDAFIVVGVDENPGGRARVVGVAHQLNDADVQQLVNTKTNEPVAFEYVPVAIDQLAAAIIHIKRDQHRPIYLQRGFGRLRPNVVYIRRGSSTDEANPTEIARMGATSHASEVAQIALELADPSERHAMGTTLTITSRLLEERPESARDELRSLQRRFSTSTLGIGPDPKKVTAYRKEIAVLTRLGFRARNTGRVLIEDVRVRVEVPKDDDLRLLDALPRRPRNLIDDMVPMASFRRPIDTTIEEYDDHWEIVATLGKIQPDAFAWSEPFWLGAASQRDLSLTARIFADNLATPIDVPLAITINTAAGWLGLDDDSDDEDETA